MLNGNPIFAGELTKAAQSFGVLVLNQTVIVWGVLGLVLLDAVLLYFAIQLFQRETILTRWK